MYKEIVEILKCPCCGTDLELITEKEENGEIIEGQLICAKKHTYKIFAGVIDFGSEEQKNSNNWSELYQEVTYDELDAAIDDRKSENQKQIERLSLDGITNKTSKLEKGFLLDVASGRGMLLRKLLETTNEQVHIIASDLSFQVLMYDRVKFAKINPRIKVSYIACDATNLVFKDNSIDMVCTFVGYLNMGNLMEKGIIEAARVLKPTCSLINTVMYMNEDSTGYQELKKIFEENDMASMAQYILRDRLFEIHQKNFKKVSDQITYEGIGEAFEGDLLPYAGEWFADAVITAEK